MDKPPSIHSQLLKAIAARSVWEDKCRGWAQMTLQGLRRRKTASWQADMFWPLVAETINKLTPFYYNQIFSQERLANFTSLQDQWAGASEAAADYFDHTVKQESDLDHSSEFELEWLLNIWFMLLYGRGVMKVYWDAIEGRLCHRAVHPLAMIVPNCRILAEADVYAEVRTLTVGQYQRDRRYVQDPEVIQQIRGGNSQQAGKTGAEQDTANRQGLTWSADDAEIVIWEAYERTPGGCTVHTYSPAAPDVPLRRPYGLAGKWRGKPFLPHVSVTMEIIEGGWYGPRGVAQRLAPFQQYLCKVWNEKVDAMTFWNRPIFSPTGPMANVGNISLTPGEICPAPLQAIQMPSPPLSFDQEMAMTRQVASETISMPDAGVQDPIPASQGGGGKMTATEVDYRRALATTNVDLRGKMFRLGLGADYRKGWALLVAHRPQELAWYSAGARKVLPAQALHDNYQIEPAGSPDYWNKTVKMQRAGARMQALSGNPFVRQDELAADFLRADSPDLVKRLWIPTGQKQAEEAEQEAIRIEALLMNGYAAAVRPDEDHAARIQVLFQKLEALQNLGAPMNPMAQQRLHEAIAQHMQFLQQQNPAVAKKIMAAAQQLDTTAPPANPPLPLPMTEPQPRYELPQTA